MLLWWESSDVLSLVMEFLDFRSLARLEGTARRCAVTARHPRVWRDAHERYWGTTALAPQTTLFKFSFKVRMRHWGRLPSMLLEWAEAADAARQAANHRDRRALFRRAKRFMQDLLEAASLLSKWLEQLTTDQGTVFQRPLAAPTPPESTSGKAVPGEVILQLPDVRPIRLSAASCAALQRAARHVLWNVNDAEIVELWRGSIAANGQDILELGTMAVCKVAHPALQCPQLLGLLQNIVNSVMAALPNGRSTESVRIVPVLKKVFFGDLGYQECCSSRCMNTSHDLPFDVLQGKVGHGGTLSVIFAYLAAQFGVLLCIDRDPTLAFIPCPLAAPLGLVPHHMDVFRPQSVLPSGLVHRQLKSRHQDTFLSILKVLTIIFTVRGDLEKVIWCRSGMEVLTRPEKQQHSCEHLEAFRWIAEDTW